MQGAPFQHIMYASPLQNVIALCAVVHVEDISRACCKKFIYKTMSLWGRAFVIQGIFYLKKLKSPCPMKFPCQISLHSTTGSTKLPSLTGPQKESSPLFEQIGFSFCQRLFLPDLFDICSVILQKEALKRKSFYSSSVVI